jgi:transposase-like protein
LESVEKYKLGKGSQQSIASEYGVDRTSFRQWLANYESMGPSGLAIRHTNSSYSVELKTAAVEGYLRGEGSMLAVCKMYGIRSKKQLISWIALYNGHKKLRATGGQGRGINMTKGRLTTLEERIEIVSYCISQGKDYSATIEKYGVSYQQIYSWVRKYEEQGVASLIDKRGKRKSLEVMTEVERLRAENKILKAEKKQREMEIDVLKKVQEIERRRG